MSEDKNLEPAETEGEDIEVVAHSEDEEEEAGCIINNSSALN
ncbi:hypothetical protein GCM10027160_48420 [Streptomyces calidiresistens]|nr:hypothetical protein [Streptomyces calidiresistens]